MYWVPSARAPRMAVMTASSLSHRCDSSCRQNQQTPQAGMKEAMKREDLFPLFCVSSENMVGVRALLTEIEQLMPSAFEMEEIHAFQGAEGSQTVEIHAEDCEVGNVSVSETFRGHEGLREFWTEYRKTFDEMKYTFRNVFATKEGAALEWTTQGTSNGDSVAYDGVSILEIEGDKVARFMAYFDSRTLTKQVVD